LGSITSDSGHWQQYS